MAEASETEAEESLLGTLFSPLTNALDGIGRFLLLTGQTVTWLLRPPFRIVQVLLAMDFLGVQSLFIIALTGMFSGMVLALQMTYSLRQFGAESVVGSVVAISLAREISPVFAGLMVTARAGSALAAELGNMRVTEQIDALTTMAVSPVQYLLAPRLLAAVVMLPLLCILYSCIGMVGAWLVAVKTLGVDLGLFLDNIEKYLLPSDFYMGLWKAGTFGFLICAISCNQGFNASGGAKGVGEATTRAVVQSAVAILIANYVITSLLTEI
ncbi:MAG TPA: ABC transporter permease [Polyangiaceae bacterium]|nr:ABC transporter permease [Polyangiaceae bacterium]